MDSPMDEAPFLLLRPDETHTTLVPVPEGLERIRSFKTDVAIVSVVGTQRGGKSTLMNLLHGRRLSGFGLGHFMDPKTHGLWVWPRKHPRNPDIVVLLMDTEGLDAPHIKPFYNWTLSALTLLISSLFIYQSKGSIAAAETERLGVILKVGEQLSGGAQEGGQPRFIWLIRDHQLEMRHSPRDEMLEKLDDFSRKSMSQCFVEYDCFPLPRPAEKDEDLRLLDQKKFDDLAAPFREEFVVLERQVYNSVSKPRQICEGMPTTGDMLADLIVKYTSAISSQSGALRDIAHMPTQKEMIVKLAGERAVREALAFYQKEIKRKVDEMGGLPRKHSDIEGAHKECLEQTRSIFEREASLGGDEIELYRQEFLCAVEKWEEGTSFTDAGGLVQQRLLTGGFYGELLEDNRRKSKEVCQAEIRKVFDSVVGTKLQLTPSNGGYESVAQFRHDMENVPCQFGQSEQAIGPAKQQTATAFLESHHFTGLEVVANLLQEKMKETREQSEAQFSERLNQQQKSLEETKAALSQEVADNKKLIQDLTSKIDALERETKEASKATNEAVSQVDARVGKNSEGISSCVADIQKLVQTVTEDKKQLDATHANLTSKLADLENSSTQGKAETLATISTMESQLKESLSEVKTNNRVLEERVAHVKETGDALSKTFEEKVLQLAQAHSASTEKVDSVIKTIEEQLSNHARSLGGLEVAVNEEKQKLASASSELEPLKSRLSSSEAQAGDFKQGILNIQSELSKSKEDGAAAVAKVKSDAESAVEQVGSRLSEGIEATKKLFAEELEKTIKASDGRLEEQIKKVTGEVGQRIEEAKNGSSQGLDHLKESVTKTLKNMKEDFHTQFQSLTESQATLDGKYENQLLELSSSINATKEASGQSCARALESVSEVEENLNKSMDHLKEQILVSVEERVSTQQIQLSEAVAKFDDIQSKSSTMMEKAAHNAQILVEEKISAERKHLEQFREDFGVVKSQIEEKNEVLGRDLTAKMTRVEEALGSLRKQQGEDLEQIDRVVKETGQRLERVETYKQELLKEWELHAGQLSSHSEQLKGCEGRIATLEDGKKEGLDEELAALSKNIEEIQDALQKEISRVSSEWQSNFSSSQQQFESRLSENSESMKDSVQKERDFLEEHRKKLYDFVTNVSRETTQAIDKLTKDIHGIRDHLGSIEEKMQTDLKDVEASVNGFGEQVKGYEASRQDAATLVQSISEALDDQTKKLQESMGSLEEVLKDVSKKVMIHDEAIVRLDELLALVDEKSQDQLDVDMANGHLSTETAWDAGTDKDTAMVHRSAKSLVNNAKGILLRLHEKMSRCTRQLESMTSEMQSIGRKVEIGPASVRGDVTALERKIQERVDSVARSCNEMFSDVRKKVLQMENKDIDGLLAHLQRNMKEEMQRGIDQIQDSTNAIWESMGQIGCRVCDLEKHFDDGDNMTAKG